MIASTAQSMYACPASGQRAAARHEAITRYERTAGFVLIVSMTGEQCERHAYRNQSFRRRGSVGVAAYRTPARTGVTRRN